MPIHPSAFDPLCRRCDRLAGFLAQVRADHPAYHAAPVAPFGEPQAGLLVVGLAPGMHGANRTGRPFTGDHAGILLYSTLHRFGFATAPVSVSADDPLRLCDARITNAVKCLPPANKPTGAETRACNGFLAAELREHPPRVIVALGRVAHEAVLDALGLARRQHAFAHAAEHRVSETCRLLDSYHCSRYNTQTRRLTPAMFEAVFERARQLLDQP